MGIPSDTTERIQVKAENGKLDDKDSTQSGGGNVDSGYHSFTCAPTPYSQTVPEMITTSLGHDDDFPPPQISSTYSFGYPPRTLLDQARTNHPGVGEFYTRTTISNTLAPSSDPITLQTAKSDAEIEEASELAEKIQFCLKLGYSKQQIRSALLRIGPNASKNDILMAIGDVASDSGDVGTVSKAYTEGEMADNKAGNDVELVARGPSSTTEEDPDVTDNLRPIVIDGSNVAMSHGNKEYFSCKGIQIAVQYFLDRGHRDITVFVPIYRKEQTRPDAPIKNQEILNKLEAEKILVWTPSRHVNGRRVTCYDDRFIVKLAEMTKGVIVSNDNFRDLKTEKPEWKEIIEKHLLMYSFVNDRFMPPDDPLGRNGPSLDNLLRIRSLSEEKKKPECPYGKKCTYGKKCKYFHPEVPLSVSEGLKAKRQKPGTGDARQLAVEVVAVCNERNGANFKNPKPDGAKKQDDVLPTSTQRPGQRTVSPSSIGASGGSNNSAPIVNGIHPPTSNMSAITNEMNGLGIGARNGYPPFMSYPTHHGDSNSHSAGANGQPSNGLTPRLGPSIPTPPALHSQLVDGPGRNGVASAANPQRVHSHIVQQMNHSSPSAMQSYERSLLDPQLTSRMPQFPMTYPTHPSHQHPSFPSLPPYYMNEMMYHQQQQQHQQMLYQQYLSAAMNAIPPQGNPRHALPGYPPYPHYPQHAMMPPTTNLTTPHHNACRQAVYAHGHHSSPPQFQHGSQSRNGPIDQTPQSGFRDPSNPRHNLFKNLCGLFSPRIVERVMLANPRESDPKRLAKLCLDMD